MWRDPVVEEIRDIREEHAKKFNYDLYEICEYFRRQQSLSDCKVVSRQPRKPMAYLTQVAGADDAVSQRCI